MSEDGVKRLSRFLKPKTFPKAKDDVFKCLALFSTKTYSVYREFEHFLLKKCITVPVATVYCWMYLALWQYTEMLRSARHSPPRLRDAGNEGIYLKGN